MSLQGNAMSVQELRGKLTGVNAIYADAYEIAVRNGFEGTVEEWLESLKGKSSRIYVGSGEMPEGYAVQIDPTGGDPLKGFIKSVNGATPDENGNVNLEFSDLAQPDWNAEEGEPGHVLNRTHYKYRLYDDIVYDGNNEGRDVVDLTALFGAKVYAYKVSDKILTKNHYENSTMIRDTTGGNSYEYSLEYVAGGEDGDPYVFYASYFFSSIVMAIASVSVVGEINGIVFPSTGTYIAVPMWDQEKFAKVTITSKEVAKPLDDEYIPESVARIEELKKVATLVDDLMHGFINKSDYTEDILESEYENSCFIKKVLLGSISISPYAFRGCSYLEQVDLVRGAVRIGTEAFAECKNLKIFNSLRIFSVENGAFKNCGSLINISLTDNSDIGDSAFSGCTAMTFVSISREGLLNPGTGGIGKEAFSGCSSLETVYIHGGFMPLQDVNAFAGTPIANGNGTIYVTDYYYQSYLSDPKWSTYANVIRREGE